MVITQLQEMWRWLMKSVAGELIGTAGASKLIMLSLLRQ